MHTSGGSVSPEPFCLHVFVIVLGPSRQCSETPNVYSVQRHVYSQKTFIIAWVIIRSNFSDLLEKFQQIGTFFLIVSYCRKSSCDDILALAHTAHFSMFQNIFLCFNHFDWCSRTTDNLCTKRRWAAELVVALAFFFVLVIVTVYQTHASDTESTGDSKWTSEEDRQLNLDNRAAHQNDKLPTMARETGFEG